MKSPIWNLLTVFVGGCAVAIAFTLWWFGRGESIAVIAQILVAPFLLDISEGVGERVAGAFRWVTCVSFLAVSGLLVFRCLAKEKKAKTALSAAGILAVIVHFSIVLLGYVSTGLH